MQMGIKSATFFMIASCISYTLYSMEQKGPQDPLNQALHACQATNGELVAKIRAIKPKLSPQQAAELNQKLESLAQKIATIKKQLETPSTN